MDDKLLNYCIDQYEKEERSLGDIAKELKMHPNTIRRALIKKKVPMRDKGAAQALALKSGRHEHPTQGKKRSEATKIKISESISTVWANLTPEELKVRSDNAKEQWENMSEEDRQLFKKAANEALRKSSKDGSKLEKMVVEDLTKAKFVVEYHKEILIPNQRLHVDIFLPQQGVAIEIDGPSHFLPIWGHENLQKVIRADAEKNGLLLLQGFVIIRIKNSGKSISAKTRRDLSAKLIDLISQKFPDKNHRLIEVKI